MRMPETGNSGEGRDGANLWRVSRRGLAGAASLVVTLMASRAAQAQQTNVTLPRRRRPRCFLAGTRILTPQGEVEIGRLRTGDLVSTVGGAARPIKQIATWSFVHATADPVPRAAWPVRIRRHAIDACTPSRDLYVTAAHAVFLDGMLVSVGSLVNGSTIAPVDPAQTGPVTFFHIELETHDVIIANGTPCETLRADATTVPYAPIVGYNGGRAELRSRVRSAFAPLADRRTALDRLRDRLENRAAGMQRAA